MRVTYLDVMGIKTRCYTAGSSGPPLMLIHGIGSSSDSWMKVINQLGEQFQVVAPDLMGHGFTGLGDYSGGPPQPVMVKHLHGVADAMGWGKFSVFGSSYGALLSVLCHLADKERVEKVIMLGSASATMGDAERLVSFNAARAAALATIAEPTVEFARKRMGGMVYDVSCIPPELLFLQMNIFARPGLREGLETIMDGMMDLEATRPWTITGRFNEIACPLLMIWGENDPHAKIDRALEAARSARDARFVTVARCGHVPHLEHPEQVVTLARRFLQGDAMAEYRLAA
ncbi:alpha/beta fold hydrolase [Roseomonas chloroacetimidivorans]|jgi:pimeloyl-ACP methyl ester carboxylesterase|uniref:alpha/beta fold hydrolase n=1 Tax=Roseomonas chloroacetimidivorans TaxID=1766656 RepID=UPI003C73FFF3